MLITLKLSVRKYHQTGSSIPKLFGETVKKYPNKTCFLYEDQRWTFQVGCRCLNELVIVTMSPSPRGGDSCGNEQGYYLRFDPQYWVTTCTKGSHYICKNSSVIITDGYV